MVTTNLRDRVTELLRNRPATLKFKKIEEDTTIPAGWLKMLARGKIEEPSGNRLETLYAYFTGKKLEV